MIEMVPDKRGKNAVGLLEKELELAKEDPPNEVLIVTICKDDSINFSYTRSDDFLRLLGMLEVLKEQTLQRMNRDE